MKITIQRAADRTAAIRRAREPPNGVLRQRGRPGNSETEDAIPPRSGRRRPRPPSPPPGMEVPLRRPRGSRQPKVAKKSKEEGLKEIIAIMKTEIVDLQEQLAKAEAEKATANEKVRSLEIESTCLKLDNRRLLERNAQIETHIREAVECVLSSVRSMKSSLQDYKNS